jgi:hypothetical protein
VKGLVLLNLYCENHVACDVLGLFDVAQLCAADPLALNLDDVRLCVIHYPALVVKLLLGHGHALLHSVVQILKSAHKGLFDYWRRALAAAPSSSALNKPLTS